MIKIFQDTDRNCLQAAVASLLEMDLEEVPDFADGLHDMQGMECFIRLRSFLKKFQLDCIATHFPSDEWDFLVPDCYCIIGAETIDGNMHAFVGKGFEIIHDPCIEGTKLKSYDFHDWEFLYIFQHKPEPKYKLANKEEYEVDNSLLEKQAIYGGAVEGDKTEYKYDEYKRDEKPS